jgi:nitric oxide reductase subunit B
MIAAQKKSDNELSPRWKFGVILTLVIGFAVLIWIAFLAYEDAPPIPEKIVSPSGQTLITGGDIIAGQQVFLRYGLMENGTIWGHGAYLGPDFSAQYLHTLGMDGIRKCKDFMVGIGYADGNKRDSVTGDVTRSLK